MEQSSIYKYIADCDPLRHTISMNYAHTQNHYVIIRVYIRYDIHFYNFNVAINTFLLYYILV